MSRRRARLHHQLPLWLCLSACDPPAPPAPPNQAPLAPPAPSEPPKKAARLTARGKWRGEVELLRLPRLRLLDAMNAKPPGSGLAKEIQKESERVLLELSSSDEGAVRGQLGNSLVRGEYREDALRLSVDGDLSGFVVLSPEPSAESPMRLVGRLRLASADAKKIYTAEVELTRASEGEVLP